LPNLSQRLRRPLNETVEGQHDLLALLFTAPESQNDKRINSCLFRRGMLLTFFLNKLTAISSGVNYPRGAFGGYLACPSDLGMHE